MCLQEPQVLQVQEESRINVNLLLHGNDDVLTKLNPEKDIAGQRA